MAESLPVSDTWGSCEHTLKRKRVLKKVRTGHEDEARS